MCNICFSRYSSFFFFFNDTATTEIYTLSLHDALPILRRPAPAVHTGRDVGPAAGPASRSEEHTSELQSRFDLVCRLLLEKKKNKNLTMRFLTFILTTHTLYVG